MDDRARRGDAMRTEDRMFVQAWNRVKPELERRARKLSNGHQDRADDLLSATAVKALLFMRRAPERMTDPEGFLFVVLRHVFLDSVRRNRRDREVFDHGVEIGSDRIAATSSSNLSQMQCIELEEQLARVVGAVRNLTRDQRGLFGLRFIQELPYPAIATRLCINQALARKRVQLLRRRLRRECGRGREIGLEDVD
jgi:RNA polymerase sigma-70 factor (ECF subfamily)